MVNVERFKKMLKYEGKVAKFVGRDIIERFSNYYFQLQDEISKGKLPSDNNYLKNSELAERIYKNKYFLRDLNGEFIDERPEDVFARISSFISAIEGNDKYLEEWYRILYEGYFLPGGRVIAAAGDLYRTKTPVNCFALEIEDDSIEGIFDAAKYTARTYSYGGGVGIDVSVLRPKGSIVHNASLFSTGAVSFMELYSLTTGLIGQQGRRGALMITIDVKHPDIFHFIRSKSEPNFFTSMILQELKWKGLDEETFEKVKKVIINNCQIRFANISVKFSDEFFLAVEEENRYGRNKILVYKKKYKGILRKAYQFKEVSSYSYGIPSKDISKYELIKIFNDFFELKEWLDSLGYDIREEDLKDPYKRDVYGDYVIELEDKDYDLAIKYSGDFLLYFASEQTGEIRKLVKARDIWNEFIKSNYYSAEPGMMIWSRMKKYSPSDYLGVPIITTNPCSEVPLQPGGACNLGSLNLARYVKNPFTDKAEIDWEKLKYVIRLAVRLLDDVVTWSALMNPLDVQKKAARETRRIGLGIMGLADMLVQLQLEYDSDEGIKMTEKVMKFIANEAYKTSSELAREKGTFPLWNYEKYSRNPFFQEALTEDTKEIIKENGLRNIALLSVAPTGTISNIVKVAELNGKIYLGVSNGIEPIFSLFYTRRSESLDKKFFRVFHPIAQYYIDLHGLKDRVQEVSEEELEKLLPRYFFKTAHRIDPMKRVEIQGIVQRYVDHSISSTINLPEDVEPEVISEIYLEAWKKGLKSVTIYRDGSRYPVLMVNKKNSEFSKFKNMKFVIEIDGERKEVKGNEVIVYKGRLTTPYHLYKKGIINLNHA